MEIRSVLVHVGLNPTASSLAYATGLAKSFGARLIGVAAAEPGFVVVGPDGGHMAMEYYAAERAEIERQLTAAEVMFRKSVPEGIASTWIGPIANATDILIDAAGSADVLVIGADTPTSGVGSVDIGHLVLAAGRPVIVASPGAQFTLNKIFVAWKDTREARRALADALPLLVKAGEVQLLTITEGDKVAETAKLREAVEWLALHGVRSTSAVIGDDAAYLDVLESKARAEGADLVISGGYGHSRLREWLMGGMTRNLLAATTLNRMFSN